MEVMELLVTAGNTRTPIDKVRCITNIFSGRTGAAIALEAYRRGHHITLLTSHPDVVPTMIKGEAALESSRWTVRTYKTFNELQSLMADSISEVTLDAVIHAAAVNDYEAASVFAPAEGTSFHPQSGMWLGNPPRLVDRAAGKVKSTEAELWIKLERLPKLGDKIRADWNFTGVFVSFKLESGVEESRLIEIAEASRVRSGADFTVANTIEQATSCAYVGPVSGKYQRVDRGMLADKILSLVESKHEERRHG